MATKGRPLRELSDRVGIARHDLDRYLREGAIEERLIVRTDGGHRKVLDLDEAERQLRAFLDGPTDAATDDIERWRCHRERFAALREELKYRVESGDLLDRTEAERAIADAVTVLRERIAQVPGQLAADLAAMADAFDVETALRGAIDQALADFRVRVGAEVLGGAG